MEIEKTSEADFNTWPDPTRPGYPPNPEITAYYWVRYKPRFVGNFTSFGTDDDPFPFLWDAGIQGWLNKSVFSADAIARLAEYIEPCPWPKSYQANS